jgi:hypothetical protein
MMAIEINNGSAVSRFYFDGSGELLAVFQYTSDADKWAEQQLKDACAVSKDPIYLVRTCLRTGRSRAFHAPVTGEAPKPFG